MGAISFSIDLNLVKYLKENLPFNVFVETGTFEGETLEKIIPYFDKIYSVEIADYYYQKAIQRFKDQENIFLILNSSPNFLNEIRPQLQDEATLFWLDAHWCSAEATDEHISQCPLVQEIKAIQKLNDDSVILIDDARLFTCPPPKPHSLNEWPRFSAILDALFQISDRHQLLIYNDVIVYYPSRIDNDINQYAYENSVDWLQIKHLANYGKEFKKQLELKEQEIVRLSTIAQNRDQDLSLKDLEIQNKQQALLEISSAVQLLQDSLLEKEKEIQSISMEANARLTIINGQSSTISEQSEEINRLKNLI